MTSRINPEKTKYDNEHTYSSAPEAITKYAIDLQCISGDYSKGREVSIDNERYLKYLIEKGSICKHKVKVADKA
jgi:hypothetical protein